MKTLQILLETLPRPGVVEWIGIRPARRAPMQVEERVSFDTSLGVIGDHYAGRRGQRHVTLIQHEHLPAIGSLVGMAAVAPEALRRNIVVSGINLLALRDKLVLIGDAVVEITGLCHPCSRMEEILGPGGYNAVRGHGGVTARIVRSGQVSLGDAVTFTVEDEL